MVTENEKFKKMTETPIPKLISRLAVPTILSMLVTSLYNMADTFFIGKISGTTEQVTSATASVAVVFSLMSVIQAVGFFFGHGSSNFISRALGRQDVESAETMATFGFVTSVFFGVIMCVLGLIFIKPLAYGLGSTDTILPYAVDYMKFILIGAPLMCGSLVLNNQMRFQGNAVYSMLGIISGAVLNVALDAFFILHMGMGTDGAGIATAIGQTVSFIVLYSGMRFGNNVKIKLTKYRFNSELMKEVFRGGLPALARQGLAGLATVSLNFVAKDYGGDVTIAVMGIVARVLAFFVSIILGFGQGFQPVCGYNYGAGKYSRVKEGFLFCIKTMEVIVVVLVVVLFVFSPYVIRAFSSDERIITLGSRALRIQCFLLLFVPTTSYTSMLLQTIGKALPSTILSMARQGFFFLPMVFLLPLVLDVNGLIMAQLVADILSFFLALFFISKEKRIFNAYQAEHPQ